MRLFEMQGASKMGASVVPKALLGLAKEAVLADVTTEAGLGLYAIEYLDARLQ
jgi:hypothetical protein